MNPRARSSAPRSTAFALTLLALFGSLAGCARVQPVRTLPNWVRGVYVPMVQNVSREPGMEETATQLIQEEFLADGRLNVVPKDQADVMVVVRIRDFFELIEDTADDNIPDVMEMNIISELELREPTEDAMEPGDPIAKIGPIETRYGYPSDTRSTGVVIDPDARRNALQILARQVVDQTLTGFPAELQGGAPGLLAPQAPDAPSIGGEGFRQRGSFSR